MAPVTASMLYDLLQCEHRPWMDRNGDPALRDEPSPFVQLLWERGHTHERELIAGMTERFLDLSQYGPDERERLTLEAMARTEPLIYQGRISADDLLGVPDLLRWEGTGYVPGDIKSGAGEEGGSEDGDDGKLKKHYGVQIALYVDILERLGLSGGQRGFVWDIHAKEVDYDLTQPLGPKTPSIWEIYQYWLPIARGIAGGSHTPLPAWSATCKNCWWHLACTEELTRTRDLTLLPELGRSRRDAMIPQVANIDDFAASELSGWQNGKKTVFPGIGLASLEKFHARARLIAANGQPYLTMPIALPVQALELFFDIEVDPMRDFCYLHGFVERRNGDSGSERYVAFYTEEVTLEAEREAFRSAYRYVIGFRPAAMFYFSKYERTIWRHLQQKYPDVCAPEDVEAIFADPNAVDLYFDVVKRATEWPTRDHSIKTLAKYLGFSWRDAHLSGAASIQWFHHWVETGDPAARQRLLDYNEDDCRATRVLLDGIRGLS